jgi:hypothetical protein
MFGDKRAASGLIAQLRKTLFKDQPFKLIGTGDDGRRQVVTIRPSDPVAKSDQKDNEGG